MIVQISSHRRSGTHALIDVVRGNFNTLEGYYHLEDIIGWPIEDISSNLIIVKTHEPELNRKLNFFVAKKLLSEEKAYDISSMTKHVHAYRNPYDVLKSLYYFNIAGHEPVYAISSQITFLEFLRQTGCQDANAGESRPVFWKRCVSHWVGNQDVLSFKYQEIVGEKNRVVDMLSAHLNCQPVGLGEKVVESTAIGRDTTKSMSKEDVWDESSLKFFHEVVDEKFLKGLGF